LSASPETLPTVRLATPGDEEEIMAMCRRLHAENGLFALREDKVRGCLRKYYKRDGAIVGVIGSTGALEASTCLLFSEMYYTDEWHLAELWNFVDSDFRRTRNAEALIEFGKRSAKQIGVPFITGIITNNRTAGKVRLYRRMLGYPAGAFFVFNGNWQQQSEPTIEDFWRPFETRADKRQRLKHERKNGAP
jgi:hypothetical protein